MRMTLLGSTAVALVLTLAPASAQMQQKGSDAAPQASEKNSNKESAEPRGKGSAQGESKGTKGAGDRFVSFVFFVVKHQLRLRRHELGRFG